MPVNILIGVGGTGSKVVESALMLFAAGIGPRHVHVGLLDQDQSNGNVARTQDFLKDLVSFRKAWNTRNSTNYIDWNSADDRVGPGSVELQVLFPDEDKALWCPEKRETSLDGLIGDNIDRDRQALFDNLFIPDEEEQKMSLRKGYRGRAHVGAAALVNSLIETDSALIKRLEELMEDPQQEKVNIFLVGSAFGGTGAAGFPTLARELHRIRTEGDLDNAHNINIGGILMLPYFSFDNAGGDGEAGVTSNELIPKAKLALEYYDSLFRQERAFDQFYALGWETMIPMGYREEGASEQKNPALVPELFAASAVVDFFSHQIDPDDKGADTKVFVSARNGRGIQWSDLPLNGQIQQQLGQYLRFAYYWRYVVLDLLREKPGFMRKNWVHKLVGDVDLANRETDQQLQALNKVIDDSLLWAATIQNASETQWRPGFWDFAPIATQSSDPTEPVALDLSPAEDIYDIFDHLIVAGGGAKASRGGADIYRDLVGGRIKTTNQSKGIGLAMATVVKATRTQETD